MAENNRDEDQDFSESALAALVRPSKAPPPEREEEAKADGGNGHDEDDAVLDLRALATSQAPPAPEEPAPKAEAKAAPAETKGAEPEAKPVAKAEPKPARPETGTAPVAPAQPARGAGGMITGILIGVAVAGVAAFVLMQRGDEDEPPRSELAAAEPQTVSAGEPAEATAPEPAQPAAEAAAEAEVAAGETAEAEAEAEQAAEAAEPEETEAHVSRRARATRSRTERAERPAAAEPAATAQAERPSPEAQAEPQAEEGGNQLDSVLDDALGGRPAAGGTRTVATERPAQPAAAASADMPETPTRADVSRTLGRLLPQIRQCAADQVGLANATIIVRNDGSVGSVAIAGNPFGGTPQGACMEGVIRHAQFPPFRQSTFRITYPFALRPQP